MERLKLVHDHFKYGKKDSFLQIPPAEEIIYERKGQIIKIIFNNPMFMNAITREAQNDWTLRRSDWNENYKICIIKGVDGNFSAGGDLKGWIDLDFNSKAYRELLPYGYQAFYYLRTMKPINIVFWEGVTIGGGIGLSISAKYRIATETTRFATPEAKLGHFPDLGVAIVLANARKHIGFMLGLTSFILRGKEVYQCGFANYFVKQENLPKLEQDLDEYGLNSKTVSENDITQIVQKHEEKFEQKIEWEDLCERIFSADSVEEILSRLEKEQNNSPIVKKWLQLMQNNSPFSLWITFHHLRRAKNLTLNEVLSREIDLLTTEKINYEEWRAGILAVLEKKKYDWSIKIEDLKNLKVEDYFPKIKTTDFGDLPSLRIKIAPES